MIKYNLPCHPPCHLPCCSLLCRTDRLANRRANRRADRRANRRADRSQKLFRISENSRWSRKNWQNSVKEKQVESFRAFRKVLAVEQNQLREFFGFQDV